MIGGIPCQFCKIKDMSHIVLCCLLLVVAQAYLINNCVHIIMELLFVNFRSFCGSVTILYCSIENLLGGSLPVIDAHSFIND